MDATAHLDSAVIPRQPVWVITTATDATDAEAAARAILAPSCRLQYDHLGSDPCSCVTLERRRAAEAQLEAECAVLHGPPIAPPEQEGVGALPDTALRARIDAQRSFLLATLRVDPDPACSRCAGAGEITRYMPRDNPAGRWSRGHIEDTGSTNPSGDPAGAFSVRTGLCQVPGFRHAVEEVSALIDPSGIWHSRGEQTLNQWEGMARQVLGMHPDGWVVAFDLD